MAQPDHRPDQSLNTQGSGIGPTGNRPTSEPSYQPPRFFMRLLLLLIRPEQWAEAALCAYRYTLTPLIFIIVIVSLASAVRIAQALVSVEQAAVSRYDEIFNPMLLSHGMLTIIPQAGKKTLDIHQSNYELRVDLTDKATPGELHQDMAVLVTKTQAYTKIFSSSQVIPLSRIQRYFLIAAGDNAAMHTPLNKLLDVTVDSKTLVRLVNFLRPMLLALITLIFFLISVIRIIAWALIMALLIAPGVMILNQGLSMPLRVAMRIGTAVMVPMVVIRGVLEFLNIKATLAPTSTSEFYGMLWWLAPLPLGLWAGLLASRMLTRIKPSGR